MKASIFERCATLVLVVLICTACAPSQVRHVIDASDLSGQEYALIAFSADSIPPFAMRSLEIETFSETNRPKKAGEVPIFPEQGSGQLFLYEVSVDTARFGAALFEYEADYWESVEHGPEFNVQPGTLTYLGRIQLPLVQLGTYADSGLEYPAGARIVLTDASEEDFARLAVRFPATANMQVNKAIPGSWTDSETVRLRYAPIRNTRPKTEGPDPLHDPPIPTEIIFEPTEIPPQ